jgi:hypothetical protein
MNCILAVELLFGRGALPGYQLQANSEDQYVYSGSQLLGDKLQRQEGNSPDRQLRSPSVC